jgi:hypothetical protein
VPAAVGVLEMAGSRHAMIGRVGCQAPIRGDGETQAFDNMQERPISGTADWRLHRIVLEVPETAEMIFFGVLLEGPGRTWLDDVEFEAVSEDIPTTGAGITTPVIPERPVNLDFSAGFGD